MSIIIHKIGTHIFILSEKAHTILLNIIDLDYRAPDKRVNGMDRQNDTKCHFKYSS